jgi:Ser/Thr protein kinase RdoA (MazF antagonist)
MVKFTALPAVAQREVLSNLSQVIFMQISLIQIIISAYQLGECFTEPEMIRKNRVWKISTAKGFFKIKRVLSDEINLVKQGNHIANHFQQKKIPAEIALLFSESPIFTSQEQHFFVAPWHEGFVSSEIASSEDEAYQAGILLARIHTLNLQLPKISTSRWQNFSVPDWPDISNNIFKKKMSFAQSFKNALPELMEWSRLYQKGQRELDTLRVISHGDFLPANVVWSQNNSPFIMDWEAAGYIHPQVELWGAALNWSGIFLGEVKPNFFIKMLQGYRSLKTPVLFDEKIVYAGLGSWLSWLTYKILHSSFAEAEIKIEEDIAVLKRIVKSFPELIFLSKQI